MVTARMMAGDGEMGPLMTILKELGEAYPYPQSEEVTREQILGFINDRLGDRNDIMSKLVPY